jgi:hypothetical protein
MERDCPGKVVHADFRKLLRPYNTKCEGPIAIREM